MDPIAVGDRSSNALASRIAGFVLAACSLMTIVAISHHPVVRARRGAEVIEGIVAVGAADRVVHGTLFVIVLAIVFALSVYTLQRSRLYVCITAWVAFCCGGGALVTAALIDGFFVPAFAQRFIGAAPDALTAALTVLSASAVAIQVLTAFGLIIMNAGTLLWSVDLLLDGGVSRVLGLVGSVSAIAVIGLIIFGGTLNPHSLTIIVSVQALCYLALAWRMVFPEEKAEKLKR
jgi:hypothetical protein